MRTMMMMCWLSRKQFDLHFHLHFPITHILFLHLSKSSMIMMTDHQTNCWNSMQYSLIVFLQDRQEKSGWTIHLLFCTHTREQEMKEGGRQVEKELTSARIIMSGFLKNVSMCMSMHNKHHLWPHQKTSLSLSRSPTWTGLTKPTLPPPPWANGYNRQKGLIRRHAGC